MAKPYVLLLLHLFLISGGTGASHPSSNLGGSGRKDDLAPFAASNFVSAGGDGDDAAAVDVSGESGREDNPAPSDFVSTGRDSVDSSGGSGLEDDLVNFSGGSSREDDLAPSAASEAVSECSWSSFSWTIFCALGMWYQVISGWVIVVHCLIMLALFLLLGLILWLGSKIYVALLPSWLGEWVKKIACFVGPMLAFSFALWKIGFPTPEQSMLMLNKIYLLLRNIGGSGSLFQQL